jgi:hypothetical protein
MLKRKWVRISALLVLLFGLTQFYRPELPRPPVTGDFDGPDEVRNIFKNSCYNCHSNETELSWFDQINPAYLLALSHVKEGRSFLNFSHWDSLNPNQKRSKLFDVLNVVKTFKRMPKKEYQLLHPGAQLDSAQVAVLENYILSLVTPVQYKEIATQTLLPQTKNELVKQEQVNAAPNGIPFMAEYRQWRPVSSTERFDNNTFRVILANPIAEKAIKEGNNNPYPDGAILAKVVWHQKALSNGALAPGEFSHVEFMIKNREQFRETKGWGWARWKGEALTPHGATPMFVNECINCHKPAERTDFIFTKPLLK